jgi:hypothetical protein
MVLAIAKPASIRLSDIIFLSFAILTLLILGPWWPTSEKQQRWMKEYGSETSTDATLEKTKEFAAYTVCALVFVNVINSIITQDIYIEIPRAVGKQHSMLFELSESPLYFFAALALNIYIFWCLSSWIIRRRKIRKAQSSLPGQK